MIRQPSISIPLQEFLELKSASALCEVLLDFISSEEFLQLSAEQIQDRIASVVELHEKDKIRSAELFFG